MPEIVNDQDDLHRFQSVVRGPIQLQTDATTGDGVAKQVYCSTAHNTFQIIVAGDVTAGELTIETALNTDDADTWAPFGTLTVGSELTAGEQTHFYIGVPLFAVRARISTNFDGSGVSVWYAGNIG